MQVCSTYPVLTMREFTMDTKPVYDYTLVDSIRVLEQRYAEQLEQAKLSVQQLTQSVNALRNRRLQLEMVDNDA